MEQHTIQHIHPVKNAVMDINQKEAHVYVS